MSVKLHPRDTTVAAAAAILACLAFPLSLHSSSMPAQTVSRDDVLSRLGAYLAAYEKELSSVVADERYEQEYKVASFGRAISTQRRRLESDFLFLRLPGAGAWLGFRDTFQVDGKPVGQERRDLAQRLSSGGSDAIDEARRITAENSRYNLGDVPRTINAPMLTLDLLTQERQTHFTFHIGRLEKIDGRRAMRIDFAENTRPTIVRTQQEADQRARGTVWVDPEDGGVEKTMLDLGDDSPTEDFVHTRITVTYAQELTLGLRVPVEMVEVYSRRPQDDGLSFQIVAQARYSRFRRFLVDARILPN